MYKLLSAAVLGLVATTSALNLDAESELALYKEDKELDEADIDSDDEDGSGDSGDDVDSDDDDQIEADED